MVGQRYALYIITFGVALIAAAIAFAVVSGYRLGPICVGFNGVIVILLGLGLYAAMKPPQ